MTKFSKSADTHQRAAFLAMSGLGQPTAGGLSLGEVMSRALAKIGGLLNAETTAIRLIEGDQLIVAAVGQETLAHATGVRVQRDEGVAGYVARTGEAVWLNGQGSNIPGLQVNRELEQRLGIQVGSMLAAPLTWAGETIGVLEAGHRDPDGLKPEDLPILVAAANWGVIALVNARLFEQARAAGEQRALLEERNRLARELHDAVTQILYSITTLAGAWRRQIDAGTLQPSKAHIEELGDLAQQALREVRLLIYELRPSELDEEGLVGALYQRLEAVEKRAGIRTHMQVTDADGQPYHAAGAGREAMIDFYRLPPRVEHGLFRVAQESLNNALKHSGATEVRVALRMGRHTLTMEIEDNGRGFDTQTRANGQGFGLQSMRERAEQLGGRLSVTTNPLGGTKVRIEGVPYRLVEAEEMIE